jgi:putative transposase
MKKKSSPRLKNFDYKGPYAYSITICTHQKRRYFENPQVVDLVLNYLVKEAQRHSYQIYGYCFMPDHLHLLVKGQVNSTLKGFIKAFKQKAAFYFKKTFSDKLWHLSYYDHVLRREKSLVDVALYIFNNPVRAHLVENFKDYPYLGSLIFDINEM